MTEKKSYKDLLRDLDEYFKYSFEYVTHVKSGREYFIKDFKYLESNMEIYFEYNPIEEPNVLFLRPVSELFDGRFKFDKDSLNEGIPTN